MRSPADMRTIQIDITNACMNTCSNCTRMCGHHKKPFFMEEKVFHQAVHSLRDFTGTVGMIGRRTHPAPAVCTIRPIPSQTLSAPARYQALEYAHYGFFDIHLG
jgi:hypothetical protein